METPNLESFSLEETIEHLAGAGYGPEKIAMYLDIPTVKFMREWRNPESLFRFHYDRGCLLVDAEIGVKLAENAKGGNITAVQQLAKIRTEQFVQDVKKQIYFSSELDEV